MVWLQLHKEGTNMMFENHYNAVILVMLHVA